MSWNSTRTALASLAAIVITGFHYGVDLVQLVPIIAPIGAYIALRERSRVSAN